MERNESEGTVETVNTSQAQNGRQGYVVPRSMTTIRYRQHQGPGTPSLVERPGLQRFRTLPEPVASQVLEFLEEVRLSKPEYSCAHSRAWRDFLQHFSLIFFEPFQSPRHFAAKDALSESKFSRYAENLISALRPILLALREDESPRVRTTLDLVVGSANDGETPTEALRA